MELQQEFERHKSLGKKANKVVPQKQSMLTTFEKSGPVKTDIAESETPNSNSNIFETQNYETQDAINITQEDIGLSPKIAPIPNKKPKS